jgi:hypothetical protein
MTINVEEDYLDVLQNLEFMIIQLYRENPDLVDAEVLNAVESLTRKYGAEAEGKSISSRPLRELTKQIANVLEEMAEFRLGRSPSEDGLMRSVDADPEAPGLERPEPMPGDTCCLPETNSVIH